MSRPCRSCGSSTTERTATWRCKPCYNSACRASKARRWEKHKAESRAWSKANSARISAERAQRRHDDPAYGERIAAQSARIKKEWRAANPAAHRAAQATRRATKLEVGGSFTVEEFAALCAEFGDRCLCCGAGDRQLTADHVIPLSRRGPNFIENIQPLCVPCNCRKGTRTIDYRPAARAILAGRAA
jgi:5-methylcytosine-specific restriction endonuclease McrA